jgi:hypothetical protein
MRRSVRPIVLCLGTGVAAGIALPADTTHVTPFTSVHEQQAPETQRVLPAPPSAIRSFPPNDTIALYAEIYDDGRSVPHKVQITTTALRSDSGTEHFQHRDERDSKGLGGRRGGYQHSLRVPLKGVPPGRSVLSVEAQSRVQVPIASRQVRITVTGAR